MDDVIAGFTRHKLDVHDYHRMAAVGILHAGSRVELIEGELIDIAPIGPDHAATVMGLSQALFEAVGSEASVSVQNPVHLNRFSEPQPDILVLRKRPDNYRGSHPEVPDVLALIEVADSSLAYDRRVKLELYAKAGIAEYWIVDLDRRVLDVHRGPVGGRYADVRTYGPGERVTLGQASSITIPLDRVFD